MSENESNDGESSDAKAAVANDAAAEEEEIDDVEEDVDDDEEEEEVGMPFSAPGGGSDTRNLVDKQQRQQTHMAGKNKMRFHLLIVIVNLLPSF